MDELIYDTKDCMDFVKKKYPFIPRWIIRRVLFSEELYMKEVGIIDYEPKLSYWCFNKDES